MHIWCLVIAVFLLGLGALCEYRSFEEFHRPTTEGRVVRVDEHVVSTKKRSEFKVKYEYAVAGTSFGKEASFWEPIGKGQTIKVYYDSANPQNATIHPGDMIIWGGFLILISVILAGNTIAEMMGINLWGDKKA